MSSIIRRLISKTLDQFVGSGVGVDEDGRLCLPDGLDADRVHRFIELVTTERYACPKAAMHDLFARVGVDPRAIEVLNLILGDQGDLDWSAIGHHPLALSTALPRLLEIPVRFRAFLVEDLGLADPSGESLEDAVVSTRLRAAELLECEPSWDEILSRPEGVGGLSRSWREGAGC